jgi:hypothetical protein
MFSPLLARSQSKAELAFSASPISTAKNFLSRLYPELIGKGYLGKVELSAPIDRGWNSTPLFNFVVSESSAAPSRNSAKVGARPTLMTENVVLGALFGFDSNGILEDLHAHSSRILSDAKVENLRKIVDSHRGWTDAEVEDALKKAGAQFGPSRGDALINALPRDVLEEMLGPFKINSSDFRLRHEQPSGSLAELYWELNVSSTTAEGKSLRWALTLEPFTGRLTAITRFSSDRP